MKPARPSVQGSGALVVAGLALLLLTTLYAASIGPVWRASEILGLDPRFLQVTYAPIFWLHDHTRLREPLEWYVNLFQR